MPMMEWEEWWGSPEYNELRIALAESGAEYDQDFDLEVWEEKEYLKYCDNFLEKRNPWTARYAGRDDLRGLDVGEIVATEQCPECGAILTTAVSEYSEYCSYMKHRSTYRTLKTTHEEENCIRYLAKELRLLKDRADVMAFTHL